MKILVVHALYYKNDRNTIKEHLYSFKRYSNHECYYLNTAYRIPEYVTVINFDLIIYHYSFWDFLRSIELAKRGAFQDCKLFRELKGYKVAITQDEYLFSDRLSEFLFGFGIKTVFTLYPESEWQRIFPCKKSGLEHYFTVFAGYIDEIALKKLAKSNRDHKFRPIDVGYRGRKVPYWVGRHGTTKWQLTERFLDAAAGQNLKLDLSNDENDALLGCKWYGFLGKCRVALGCESGASLHDPDGSIREKVEEYVDKRPEASFEEVEQACFPGLDGNIAGFPVSPRVLEACMTRTCQALVEGEYGGILKPGVHYIEIKKDWSNMAEVIEQIKDVEYCERIAENAYRDIVESGLYTYRRFVEQVLDHVKSVYQPVADSNPREAYYLKLLEAREKFPLVFSPVQFCIPRMKYTGYRMLLKLNLHANYKKLESRISNRSQAGIK